MRAGRLRHIIEIKQPVTGRDGAGAALTTLTTILRTRAHMGVTTGKEYWANDYVATEYDVVAVMRYHAVIKEDMQLHYDGDVFDIKSILDPTGYKRELRVFCKRHA